MYFTSFRCNRILFRWYTNKEWQRSFFMRQLQKVKVVKVKVESWEYLLNFQIDWEETTTFVKNCAGSSRIWLSSPPPRLPSPPHLWVPPITEAEASSSGQKILSPWLPLSYYSKWKVLMAVIVWRFEVVNKEVGGCPISYNLQPACVRKLEIIWLYALIATLISLNGNIVNPSVPNM